MIMIVLLLCTTEPVNAVYFDYAKAFDRVHKKILIFRLEKVEFRDSLLWVSGFFYQVAS